MEELVNFIDELLDSLLLEADRLNDAALKDLNEWLTQFSTETSNGTVILVNDETVANLISSAKKRLRDTLSGREYKTFAEQILNSFDEIVDNVIDLNTEINDFDISDAFKKRVISPIRTQAIRQASSLLSPTSINAQVINPMTKTMFEAVETGLTIPQAQRLMAQRLNFGKYIGQITRDAFFQLDGDINNQIMEEFELDGIMYVGSNVRDTRGQCRRWTKLRRIPKSKLTREINWAKRGGEYSGHKKSGMIPETRANNFTIFRGGYNCRHRAIPVRLTQEDYDNYERDSSFPA